MLQALFLFLIRAYWKIIPMHWRRKCIFRVSCSKFVYDQTLRKGFLCGLSALKIRWRRCRPRYTVELTNGEYHVQCCDGYIAKPIEIADSVLLPYRNSLQQGKPEALRTLLDSEHQQSMKVFKKTNIFRKVKTEGVVPSDVIKQLSKTSQGLNSTLVEQYQMVEEELLKELDQKKTDY